MTQIVSNEYVLGDGEIYLDPYNTSGNLTGEINIGNVPDFTISSQFQTEDINAPQGNIMVLNDNIITERKYTAELACENMSGVVLSLYLRGSRIDQVDPVAANKVSTITVKKGRTYQVGTDGTHPTGARNISGVVVRTGATTWVLNTDYTIEPVRGRIYITETSNIPEDSTISIEFDAPQNSYERVQADSQGTLIVALRFLSANRSGKKRDVFAPKAVLTPQNQLAVIGEALTAASFAVSFVPVNGVWFYLDDAPVGV